jgi:hypothetical protein
MLRRFSRTLRTTKPVDPELAVIVVVEQRWSNEAKRIWTTTFEGRHRRGKIRPATRVSSASPDLLPARGESAGQWSNGEEECLLESSR